MLVGYMRVSSADERQSVDLQRGALEVLLDLKSQAVLHTFLKKEPVSWCPRTASMSSAVPRMWSALTAGPPLASLFSGAASG
jgi:hypothetical protein